MIKMLIQGYISKENIGINGKKKKKKSVNKIMVQLFNVVVCIYKNNWA